MININQETLFSKTKFPYVVPVEDLSHTSFCKKLILCKRISKCAISRKVKKFYRDLKKSGVSGGLYDIISRNSSTDKHPKLSQIKSERKDSSTEGNP